MLAGAGRYGLISRMMTSSVISPTCEIDDTLTFCFTPSLFIISLLSP